MASVDSFGAKGALEVNGQSYEIFRLAGIEGADTLPYSLKVLLENLLRTEDGANITAEHITKLGNWDQNAAPDTEIQFTPARVIMQDFTGVPCVVDLATMREAVGGIEAEAAMLGQPVSMLIPKVVGFKLTGSVPAGATATDVVLTITQMLRKHGVVGKFVEFYGDGVAAVPLANRATIGNMSPEFGSTAAIFPIDDVTLDYLP